MGSHYAETHVVQAQAEGRRIRGRAVECMREVVRLLDLQVTAEGDESGDDHDEHNDDFYDTEDVQQTQTPVETGAVQNESECESCPADKTGFPVPVA